MSKAHNIFYGTIIVGLLGAAVWVQGKENEYNATRFSALTLENISDKNHDGIDDFKVTAKSGNVVYFLSRPNSTYKRADEQDMSYYLLE